MKENIYNIDVAFGHGAPISKKMLVVLYIGLIDFLILPLITIVLLIQRGVNSIEWESEMTIALVMCYILFLPLFALFLYILIKDKKLKTKINLWLVDAVQTIAYSKTIDTWQPVFYLPQERMIEIKFHIGNKLYKKTSSGKAIGGKRGYARFYNKYADKKIRILYSTKYDEVLLLKE